MADELKIGIEHARQWKAPTLLSASIIGCLVFAAPVHADTDAEQLKIMQQKLETIQNELSQMTSGLVSQSSSSAGMPLHGFMDVGFATNSQANSVVANPYVPNPKGFYEGRLSFYMAPHFGDRVKALAEPNFEVSQSDGTVAVDIERLQIGYTFSDAATLWGGRFHSPYGYWNTAFHHGAQLQTSILRPRFIDFEDNGGILPAHMLGIWGTGKTKAGMGKFTYDWYFGNGPKIVDAVNAPSSPANYQSGGLDPNIAGDDNHSAMVGLNLGYEFSGVLDGLRLAVHWLNGDVNAYDITAPTTILNTTNLNTGGGSVVYLSNDWEIMSEYYDFNDKDKATDLKYKSRAGYVQIARSFDAWTPFVRVERTILDQNDKYFSMQANGQSYARQVLGLRYNLSQKACLKLELMNSSFKAETGRTALDYRSMNIQYAIGF
jgi:hypothetical protein